MTLLDDTELSMGPLKISLLREFMNKFDTLGQAVTADNTEDKEEGAEETPKAPERSANDRSLDVLTECALIALKQYAPGKYKSAKQVEDAADLIMIYRIIEAASGIKMDAEGNALAAEILG